MTNRFQPALFALAFAAATSAWMAAQAKPTAPLVSLVQASPKTFPNENAFPANSSVQIDKAKNRIALGDGARLTLQAGPESRMMSFLANGVQAAGLFNPDITVPAHAQVTFTIVNVDDDMNHDFAITRQAPPYATAFVAAPGTVSTASLASHESEKAPFHAETIVVKTGAAGSGYYVCSIRGHAKQGMYGKFVVQ